MNNRANVVPKPKPKIPQSINAMHTRVPLGSAAINFMFESLQGYNQYLASWGVDLRVGLTPEYGLGMFALRDFGCGELIAVDSCIVFAQDRASFEVEPICPRCTCMPVCSCGYLEVRMETAGEDEIELRTLDPRLVGAVDLANNIRSLEDLRLFYRKRYTDVYPDRHCCVDRVSAMSGYPSHLLDELTVGID